MTSDSSDRSVRISAKATVMTIAGSDPSGGAGLQADLKAFQQVGCYGMSVVTLITAQNTLGVQALELLPTHLIEAQLNSVVDDIPPRVVKTGALGSAEIIRVVATRLRALRLPLVVDPVLVSKHGISLAEDSAVAAYKEHLLPLATLVTPNRFEVEKLVGRRLTSLQDIANAAAELRNMGPTFVLVKAGEFDGKRHHLFATPTKVIGLELTSIESQQTHGAGCSLSAIIAARLSLTLNDKVSEEVIRDAVGFGISATHHAIRFAPELGAGSGPIESRVLHVGN